jgi:hypothetical protein
MAPILFCAVIASITAIGLVKRPKSPGYKIHPPRRGRCHGSRSMGRRHLDVRDVREVALRHQVRREISNARNESGLVIDKQEYGALRRKALVAAAAAVLGLIYRLRIAHGVLLLQSRSLLPCISLKPPNAVYLDLRYPITLICVQRLAALGFSAKTVMVGFPPPISGAIWL